jgi:hypothetical protein
MKNEMCRMKILKRALCVWFSAHSAFFILHSAF